ncbi:MAG: acetolactate decarboxylase [Deltaproteobacteria bacterium]|nr:acetolactate decarboxylase [Deltaproteobacteria bacterium]
MKQALLILLFFGLLPSAWAEPELDTDLLYQTSKLDDLISGRYDGKIKLSTVKKQGDFGLGTFNRLDGEMVLLQGNFYQIKSDGKAYLLTDAVVKSSKTPFAAVTFFETDRKAATDQPLNLEQLKTFLDSLLLNKETFYAVKIEGSFQYLKARAPLPQKKPYPPIEEAEKTQAVFEFKEVKGTLVGFRCPESAKGTNFPGYHFHFLTEDKQAGGHLLELTTGEISVSIDETPRHQVASEK